MFVLGGSRSVFFLGGAYALTFFLGGGGGETASPRAQGDKTGCFWGVLGVSTVDGGNPTLFGVL